MGLLIGAIHSLTPDGIKYSQKLKLFRHIKNLDADYILIDLGAGAHFNTIDTFLLADKKLIAIVPEITAIENMYYFLKTAFFRKLMTTLGDHGLKDVVQNTWKNRGTYNISNLNELIVYLKSLDAVCPAISCLRPILYGAGIGVVAVVNLDRERLRVSRKPWKSRRQGAGPQTNEDFLQARQHGIL